MIDVCVEPPTMVIRLDRPAARNAVTPEMSRAVEEALDRFEADAELRVGILTATTVGDRPVFCAGADLKVLAAGRGAEIPSPKGRFCGFTHYPRTKPFIVAVDGLATAGGCEIVLAADLVVATQRSGFGLTEVRRGLIAGAGGIHRLAWLLGRTAAAEVVLTGGVLPASRAYELGLVNRLIEGTDPMPAAREIARDITAGAPLAVQASRAILAAAQTGDEATLEQMTAELMAQLEGSEDLQEGLRCFVEKRPPVWRGR